MASKLETRDVEPLTLRGAFQPSSIDDKARTVDVQWTTGQKVLRSGWDGSYYEELSLDPKEVRMDRLTSGRAPLLANHDSSSLDSVIGVVESATIGTARVRFAQGTPAADQAWSLVKQGILSNVSVGYRTYKVEKTKGGDGQPPTIRAVDWQPFEISLCPMGADSTAQVRSSTQDKNPCVVVTLAEENRTMDKTPEEKAQEVAAAAEIDQKRTLELKTEAVKAERERSAGIRTATRSLGVDASKFAEKFIADGTDLNAVRTAVLDELAKRSEAMPIDSHIPVAKITDDQVDKFQRGAMAALFQRSSDRAVLEAKEKKLPGFANLETDAAEFRGYTLIDLAREALERRGINTRGMSKYKISDMVLQARASGLTPAADFTVLYENVMNKLLLGAYLIQSDTWSRFCKTDTVQDFRPSNRYRTGSFGSMDVVPEGEEFKNKSIPDGLKRSISTETKGNIIALTRQAMINDDMSANADVAARFGRGFKLTIEKEVYTLLAANGGLGFLPDGSTPFFDDTLNANVGTAAAITVAAIDSDRQKMANQKDISNNDYLSLKPRVLLVPTSLESTARIINDAAYDFTGSALMKPNPMQKLFADIVATPRLSGTRRYLFADAGESAAIVVAFLASSGTEPFMEQQIGFRSDGIEWKARLDFLAQWFDPKGAVTNAGA